jgi:transcriptional antiterminator
MVYLNKIKKQDLLRLFEEGRSEAEAFEETAKSYGSNSISLKTINYWFKKFRAGENSISDKRSGRKSKFTDEFLIKLVNENPDMNMLELAKLAGASQSTISARLRNINTDEKTVNYIQKRFRNAKKKISDETIINLVNENPNMNLKELAELANTSYSTIFNRLKQLDIDGGDNTYIKKGTHNGPTKFTDENLINLIRENPGLNMSELGKLVDASQSTISIRLKQINSFRSSDDKIVLEKKRTKAQRKGNKSITEESLIKLINDNPGLNGLELANIAGVSSSTLYNKLNKIIVNDRQISYIKKSKKNGEKKFTNEFLIKLVNDNPEFNTYELANLANVSQNTIINRLKDVDIEVGGTTYVKKGKKNGVRKFTDEYLINLVNENPDLNLKELAKLAKCSQNTISLRLKEVNSNGERVKYMYNKHLYKNNSMNSK